MTCVPQNEEKGVNVPRSKNLKPAEHTGQCYEVCMTRRELMRVLGLEQQGTWRTLK